MRTEFSNQTHRNGVIHMKSHKSPVAVVPRQTGAPSTLQKIASRALGVFIILMASVMFVQVTPLVVAFIGAYVGIPAQGAVQNADIIVWVLSSLAVLAAMVVVYLRIIYSVWRRMVVATVSFFKKGRTE